MKYQKKRKYNYKRIVNGKRVGFMVGQKFLTPQNVIELSLRNMH